MKRFIILPVKSLLASLLMICAILCSTDMMANNDLRKEVNETTYRLYREVVNRNDVRVNGDGTPYYRTRLMLEINKGGSKRSYELGSSLYMNDSGDVHMCMLIDFNARKVLAFANSKSTDRYYGMDGFAFVSSLDNISFSQETVFTSSNWGFFPYFVGTSSQNYTLSHFSFAGYRQMRSVRSTDGKWSSNNIGSKSPSVADAEWRGKDKMLAIGASANTNAADTNTSNSDNNSDGLCPDANHPHWIDLGIGTLWRCCNEGASTPKEYGGYYSFGEAQAYNPPSSNQLKALINNCTSEWTTLNGVKGRKFTGPNGRSIFLPAAGSRWDSEFRDVDKGYYWSSSPLAGTWGGPRGWRGGYFLRIYSYDADLGCSDGGLYTTHRISVRPVR